VESAEKAVQAMALAIEPEPEGKIPVVLVAERLL
jgi:hypothetical protein